MEQPLLAVYDVQREFRLWRKSVITLLDRYELRICDSLYLYIIDHLSYYCKRMADGWYYDDKRESRETCKDFAKYDDRYGLKSLWGKYYEFRVACRSERDGYRVTMCDDKEYQLRCIDLTLKKTEWKSDTIIGCQVKSARDDCGQFYVGEWCLSDWCRGDYDRLYIVGSNAIWWCERAPLKRVFEKLTGVSISLEALDKMIETEYPGVRKELIYDFQ